jgi:hypothetical protein
VEALEIVFFVDAAFDAKLREDGHPLSYGKSGKFGGFAEGRDS